MLRPEVNVNACCNTRIEKLSTPALRCVTMRIQINLYAFLVATPPKQNIVNSVVSKTHTICSTF